MKRAYIFSLAFFLYPTLVLALSLQDAKQQGLVGETKRGYIAAVAPQPTKDTFNLVEDINKKRQLKYQEIAKKNDTPLDDVETLAGAKAIEKTPKGQFILTTQGWKKK